jgi:hypothetical protein
VPIMNGFRRNPYFRVGFVPVLRPVGEQNCWARITNMAKAQKILDAAKVIESFVDGTCGPYDWDDFLNCSKRDAELQKIREECERVEIDYPARDKHEWCNDGGCRALMEIAARLRVDASGVENPRMAGSE